MWLKQSASVGTKLSFLFSRCHPLTKIKQWKRDLCDQIICSDCKVQGTSAHIQCMKCLDNKTIIGRRLIGLKKLAKCILTKSYTWYILLWQSIRGQICKAISYLISVTENSGGKEKTIGTLLDGCRLMTWNGCIESSSERRVNLIVVEARFSCYVEQANKTIAAPADFHSVPFVSSLYY